MSRTSKASSGGGVGSYRYESASRPKSADTADRAADGRAGTRHPSRSSLLDVISTKSRCWPGTATAAMGLAGPAAIPAAVWTAAVLAPVAVEIAAGPASPAVEIAAGSGDGGGSSGSGDGRVWRIRQRPRRHLWRRLQRLSDVRAGEDPPRAFVSALMGRLHRPNSGCRRFQRTAVRGCRFRVVSARRQLAEPADPRRVGAGDGVDDRTRASRREGADGLLRSSLRHRFQIEFPGIDPQTGVRRGP